MIGLFLLLSTAAGLVSAAPASLAEEPGLERRAAFANATYPPPGSPDGLYLGSHDLTSWTYYDSSNISLSEHLFQTSDAKNALEERKPTGPFCDGLKVPSGSKANTQQAFADEFGYYGTRFWGAWWGLQRDGITAFACNYYGPKTWSVLQTSGGYLSDMSSVDNKCGVGRGGWYSHPSNLATYGRTLSFAPFC